MVGVSCESCSSHLYDERWNPVIRGGVHLPRAAQNPPPCYTCPKVPQSVKTDPNKRGKITQADAVEWTEDSWEWWNHYWATKSGSCPPQTAYSREVCGQIEQVVALSTRRLHDPARMADHMAAMLKGGR